MKLRGWRRIANAMWQGPVDPQTYGALEIDATEMLRYIEACRAAGRKVTPAHLVGRAIGRLMRDVPEFNVRITAGRAFPRSSVDLFFITAVEGGRDLSGVKIEHVDDKSAIEIAKELGERAGAAKAGRDADLAKTKRTMDALPLPALRIALRLTKLITGDMERSFESLGLARTPFGSAILSNVGTFGLPIGFAPLSWMYGVSLLVLVGTVTDKPVVAGGEIVIRPMLPITATIDHRFVDGWHIARAMKSFRAYLEDPAAFEPEISAREAPLLDEEGAIQR